MTDFDHRLTPEGRQGFLAAIDYIHLAGQMSVDPLERGVISGLVRALRRKADMEYPIGSADR
mgnify:CR=1 FL=1